MCNHHRDVLDAIRAEEEEAAALQAQGQDQENHEAPPHPESPKEDSFEIPDNRADLDESKATDHGPLEHEHEHTPYFSYHNEKALKLEDNKYLAHETHTPSKPVAGLPTLPKNNKAAMLFDTTPENLRKLDADAGILEESKAEENTKPNFAPNDEITLELQSLYTNFQKCLDLREKYMKV
ncbi:hypothetical protein BGZ89_005002, partial [Linnemannia elongata]